MKTLFKTIAFVSVGVMALSASAFAGDAAEKKAKIKTWYEGVIADFAACDTSSIGKYSAEGHRGFYPNSADLVDENDEEAMQQAVEFCENGGNHGIEHEILDIILLKDAALLLGRGHYTRTEPDGNVSIDSNFTQTELLVKTDDGWKVKHTHIGEVLGPPDGGGDE